MSAGRPLIRLVDTGGPAPAGMDMDTVVERERPQLSANCSARITGPTPRGLRAHQGKGFQARELLISAPTLADHAPAPARSRS